MLAGAEAASRRPGTTADKLAAMHAAWFGTYAETISRSPHAAELLDAKHRLSADLVADAASRYKRLVRDVLAEAAAAGELDAASPTAYRRYLEALVRVMVAGLSSRLPSNAVSPPLA
jgi:hypothetical protein